MIKELNNDTPKIQPLIVYSASVLFLVGRNGTHYPLVSTGYYHSMGSFMDFCESNVLQDERFAKSDVLVNCVKVQVSEDGALKSLETKTRNFYNYNTRRG